MDSQERDKIVTPNVVSYVAFESVQARNERHIKRLWITNLVLITLLFLSNAIWLWFYSGFDFETYDYEQYRTALQLQRLRQLKKYGI